MFRRQPLKTGFRAVLAGTAFLFVTIFFGISSLRADSGPPLLVIVHTNDVHGQALEARDGDGRLAALGYPRLKSYYDRLEAGHKMLLDAGDVLHGQPFATARRGELVARLLAELNYDALAVGNHDFDYGLARLMELRDGYGLNFIAANIVEKEDGALLLPPYLVRDFGDLKVGVFGLTTPETPVKTSPENVEAVTFGSPAQVLETAREMVRRLREEEKADLVVALTHLGSDPLDAPSSRDLAEQTPGLDLIIDGHSHSVLAGLRVGRSLIVSTGSGLRRVGRVAVNLDASGRPVLAPRLLEAAEFETVPPEKNLAALAAGLEEELGRELGQVAARSPVELEGRRELVRTGQTGFGRVLGAAILKAAGAEAALTNSGSIRDSLPAGEITKGQMLAALPYGNYVVTVQLSGAELVEMLNLGLNQPREGGYPQFYGLKVTAREKKEYAPNGEILKKTAVEAVEIGGRPLEPEKVYSVAVNDFLKSGGDGYALLVSRPGREYGALEEVLRQYLTETAPENLQAVAEEENLIIVEEM